MGIGKRQQEVRAMLVQMRSPGQPAAGRDIRVRFWKAIARGVSSQEELRIAIITWIDWTYHRRRRKRSLRKMAPVEYEAAHEVVDKELFVT